MAGDPALIVRVTTNLDELKTGMAESKKSIETSTQAIEQFTGKAAPGLTEVDKATQGWGASLGTVGSSLAALGIAFSIDQLMSLTKEILATASELENLHAKTDITVEELQRMQIVGDGVGVSLDTMTTAGLRLQTALGKNDQGVAAALADLNIDLEHFKTLGVADQMAAVATATQQIEDPLRRAADLSELYGKNWAELFPVLKKGFSEAGDDVTVMSSRTTKALDDAGSAMGEFWRATKANFGEAFADILTLSTSEWRALKSGIDDATKSAGKMRPEGLTPVKEGLVDVSGAMALLNDGLDDQKTKVEADIKAQKQHAVDVKAAIEDEQKAQLAYADLLDHLHREALKHYEDEEAAKKKQTAVVNQTVIDGNTQIMAANAQLHDMEMKASLDTTTYQIMKIWEKAEAEIAAFKGTEQQAAIHADLVYTIADREATAITDVMAVAVDTMTSKATEGLNKVAGVADAAVAKAQQYTMAGRGSQMTAAEYDAYYQTPQGIQDIIRNKGKRYYEGEVLPRAGGGPVTSGTPYLVGERGPELFVPERSGAVVASGGGNTYITNHNYITQPLGTPDAIGEAITARMKSLGMRF